MELDLVLRLGVFVHEVGIALLSLHEGDVFVEALADQMITLVMITKDGFEVGIWDAHCIGKVFWVAKGIGLDFGCSFLNFLFSDTELNLINWPLLLELIFIR